MHAQILRGEWVEQSQRDIETHRMTDLHVLVLDLAGKPVPNVDVRVEQLEHDFTWGIVLHPDMFEQDEPVDAWRDRPVWRCFNAASLERITRWPQMQPDAQQHVDDAVDAALQWCEARHFRVRFGGVTSAHPDHLPPWLIEQDDAGLRNALEARTSHVLTRFGRRIDAFDLHTHMVDQQLVRARLGMQMIRQLHERAKAAAPDPTIAVRCENALTGTRLQSMLQLHGELRDAFVPFDEIVFDEEVSGTVVQAPLSRAMQVLNKLDAPIVIGRLEISGSSPTAAAVNMETMLRVLFAEPAIKGIYFSGVQSHQVEHEAAALIEGERPTGAGEVFDALVRKLWWTDATVAADQLGNVRTRVFAGKYRISATLPDGTAASMQVHVPQADRARMVMLQPIPVAAAPSPERDDTQAPPSEGDELFRSAPPAQPAEPKP